MPIMQVFLERISAQASTSNSITTPIKIPEWALDRNTKDFCEVKADEELEHVWCIANLAASKEKIVDALNWVCGQRDDICLNIQEDKPCYLPNTLKDHASYAFNNYYQKFKFHGASYNFGGAAVMVNASMSLQCPNLDAKDPIIVNHLKGDLF
ncbi:PLASMODESMATA CALLOSE-BINDING PROTEIN 3-like [Papaver somniferum]|uniref:PLASMODESMATA CALLOSE-BINDING PROTEIN 3-like n=1 Tax=Papaver somniferum TaxID=3469 RepID=UPI000E6F9B0F|nr:PLASMODESMATA CALLOSE-BINDING PROTEIN 3-like [Papaver somniferum]